MKILQVNNVYKKGSTGKIVYDIHSNLRQNNIDSIVCYGRGKEIFEEDVYKTANDYISKFNNLFSRLIGVQYGGSFLSTYKLLRIIKREKPDVVHLHCLNGFFVNIYWLMYFLKKNKIKTVLTLHAEFMHTGNCSHSYECDKWKTGCGECPRLKEATKSCFFDRTHNSWMKMKKCMDNFDDLIIVSVSSWLQKRAEQSPILKGKNHLTILNGINTKEIFKPQEFTYLKERHGLKQEKIILHVTADFNDPIKGGKYVIELAERLKEENIKIIIVGKGTVEDNLPSNVIWRGKIEDQKELATYYSLADVCVLTSKRETFSMICAESLCCGTPVVGFKAGGPEEIALPEYSVFVEYGDCEELIKGINKCSNYKYKIDNEAILNIHEKYNKEIMYKQYENNYRRMAEDDK